MSALELRRKYNREFAGLSKHSNFRGWLIVSLFLGQGSLAVWAGHYAIGNFSPGWAVLVSLILMVFVGTRFRALNNVVHETTHATFVTDRDQNTLIGKLCAAATMSSFTEYRDEHLSHHAHVGDYERDLDLQGIEDLALHDPLTRSTVLRHIATPLVGRHLPYYLHLNRSPRDGTFFVGLKIALLLAVLALTIAAPLTALLFVVAPFVLIYSALNYWADCMDHAGLIAGDDELDKSRNILAPRPVSWLFFPRHDCFHLVHHLFPHIPASHLKASHETLSKDEIYQHKQNAMGIFRAPDAPTLPANTEVSARNS